MWSQITHNGISHLTYISNQECDSTTTYSNSTGYYIIEASNVTWGST